MPETTTNEILFYRANGEYGYLSNLFLAAIRFEGCYFPCAEYAYQAGKSSDPAITAWLLAAPTPSLCAQAAHALLPWQVVPNWSEIKVERMRAVLRAKFEQHVDLALKLAETGNAILVEESKTDAFWGVGKKGNGKNMLGQLLMELRTAIQQGKRPKDKLPPLDIVDDRIPCPQCAAKSDLIDECTGLWECPACRQRWVVMHDG